MVVSSSGISATAAPVGNPKEISENLKALPLSSTEIGNKKYSCFFI